MDGTFIYDKYVTGRQFIGRESQAHSLANLLLNGENVAIYEAPKTGKTSLIRQAFLNMKSAGEIFCTPKVNLLNIRSLNEFMLRLGSEMLESACSTAGELDELCSTLLGDSCFRFDIEEYRENGTILQATRKMEDSDITAIFTLPYRIAEEKSMRVYVLLDEFQNIMLTGDGERACKLLYSVFQELCPADHALAAYIFCGSRPNAMHEIFGVRKLFYYSVQRFRLAEIESKEIIDHVNRSLLSSGKVIDRDLLLGMCKLFRNNIWYINHFAAICDSLSKGYIMENVLTSALSCIISVHLPHFEAIMNDLTTYQVNMLRAILCGETRFTSVETIEKYGLNSSANVKRLREALCKKEIVWFDEDGTVTVIDPLFEYWARRNYYGMEI